MATIIKTDGTLETLLPKEGEKALPLAQMQEAVGKGYIELVARRNGANLWCNEEGKLRRLPVNLVATCLWNVWLGRTAGDILVGDCLVTTDAEAGEDEDDGEDSD